MKQSNRKKRNCTNYSDEDICEALTKARGYQCDAAEILDKSPAWLSARCKDNETIQAHIKQMNEDRIDKYEQCLDRLRDDLNPTSIIYFLKNRARHRGYVEHAPLESIDTSRMKFIAEFFSSIAGSKAKPPEAKSDELEDPDSCKGKTSAPRSNFP